MRSSTLRLRDYAKLSLAALGVWFALERWFWFLAEPHQPDVRICGNCFIGLVAAPIEIGLLGLLLSASVLFRIPGSRTGAGDWWLATGGILLTPSLIGLPVFAVAYLSLLLSHAQCLVVDANPAQAT
jgi:hypothetical protein